MAFRSNGPITLALPAFRGVTRRIVLIAVGVYFVQLLLAFVAPKLQALFLDQLMLHPNELRHGTIWQLISYPFMMDSFLSVLFAVLSVWFFGSVLEDERGSGWFREYFLVATIGGGLLISLLAFAAGTHIPGLDPEQRAGGLWPAVLAILLAYARFHANEELRFNFIFRIKAKYLVGIYVLFYIAIALIGGDRFGALTALSNALCGFVYLSLAPRQGLRFAVSERWFRMRNSYYRSKRLRAAKKFTVYMRKQGKDVNIDPDGRYIDPDGNPRDPNDRNWMN
jgi:membrane associated rhomboid family serine protease